MVVGHKRWIGGGSIIGISMALQNNKSLGQHWLKNREILNLIAELAIPDMEPSAELPHCLEIGPGLGTLTSSLLRIFPKVTAVEFDERLANNLPKSFPGKNLEVVHQDFLKFDLEHVESPYVIAGNIPYYITSLIIFKILEAKNSPEKIVLLIQKEVAERIAATQGNHSVLSLTVQNLAKVELGPVVPKDLFTPPPKVDSQIIILEPLSAPQVDPKITRLIKLGFSAPRKKLIKNLVMHKVDLVPIFTKLGISLDARPADLSLQDWQSLYSELF